MYIKDRLVSLNQKRFITAGKKSQPLRYCCGLTQQVAEHHSNSELKGWDKNDLLR